MTTGWLSGVASLFAMHRIARTTIGYFGLKRKRKDTVWMLVHFMMNVWIAVQVHHECLVVWHTLSSRTNVFERFAVASTQRPMQCVVLLHTYHVLFYELNHHDVFHHAVFAGLLALPGVLFQWGCLVNYQLMFIHGVPGACVYSYIVVRRLLGLEQNWEPILSAVVNVLVRTPGILHANYLLYHTYPLLPVPFWVVAINLFLGPLNGVYYAYESLRRVWK